LIAITLSVIIAVFGVLFAYARYLANERWANALAAPFRGLQRHAENKWYVDEFYLTVIINPLRTLANWFATAVDKVAIDGLVNRVGAVSMRLGERARYLQNGAVPTYALSILIGVVLVTIYFVFS
jgi:NADH-quinone oxidoreductase subunit L